MDYAEISSRVQQDQLEIFGGLLDGETTILLLGPHEPGFWEHVTASPEFQDGTANPIDRWSTRVITTIAAEFGAEPLFPFTGPPYHPFMQWAKGSGRAWDSPVGMLVHDRAGLFVSYRGAIRLPYVVTLPVNPPKPCDTCADQPCQSACPVNALGVDGYDVAACHSFLDTPAGQDCMGNGCKARRACPVSQSYGRLAEQSAFHMRHFHK